MPTDGEEMPSILDNKRLEGNVACCFYPSVILRLMLGAWKGAVWRIGLLCSWGHCDCTSTWAHET